MRHRVEGRKLGRPSDQRSAILKNLVKSLIMHERIKTTTARAKEARRLTERVITYGKRAQEETGSVHQQRMAFRILGDHDLVKKVFDELVPRYTARTGGYTRILQIGFRKGDCAPMALLELVDRKIPEKKEDEDEKKDAKKETKKAVKAAKTARKAEAKAE
jgi:large subunit ribosomal protein L17